MISTLANPNVIKMSVPRAKSDTKSKQSVTVSIDKNKNIWVFTQKIVPDSLESVLRKYINEGDSIKPAIAISADSSAGFGEIVRVMRAATRLGASTSAIVTGSD